MMCMREKLPPNKILISGLVTLLATILYSAPLFGQGRLVTGQVTEASGEPLPGVNILIQGTAKGTVSDYNGHYRLEVPGPDAVLVFSFIGYESQEVPVQDKTTLNITLMSDLANLDEVVVVGYGTQKRKEVTGAIASVSAAQLANTVVKDPLSALQGRAAGVNVTANSGAPGAGVTVRVRGSTSLNAGNDPLYIIDGVAVEASSLSQLNAFDQTGQNPLADINPADIESIEVLKDAASTAIYGSRAANGVILITTKRGQAGKPKFTVNLSRGYSQLTRKLSVLNAAQYRDLVIDSYLNMDDPTEITYTVIDSLSATNNGDVDWQDAMYRTAPQTQVDLSVRGGSKDLKYAVSASYLDQDGVIISNNYKRFNIRFNNDFILSPKLTIGHSISFTRGLNDRVSAGGTGNKSLVVATLIRPPTYALYYPDGSLNGYFYGKRNPVALAKESLHMNKSNRLIGNQYLEWEILDGLTFHTSVGIDIISMNEDEFYPTTVDYREGYNEGSVRATDNLTWMNENYFTFRRTFRDRHDFSVLVGMSEQAWQYKVTGLDGLYYISDEITTLNGAGTISGQEVNVAAEHSLASFFGRASYHFSDKYLLELNLRADGSSRFGASNRFGYFPSASAAWRFTEENFMPTSAILDEGKLRFSAGQTGNQAIGNYTAQGQFAVGENYLDHSGAAPTVMPNAGLTWETTHQYNLGLDLTLLNNRLVVTVDAYLKRTHDLLYDVPIPKTTGFSYSTQNIGEIENKGLELAFRSTNLTGKLTWNTQLNLSFNRNRVVALPEGLLTNGYIQNGSFHILREGDPIGIFYGWKFNGVYASDEDNINGVTNGASGDVFQGGDAIWDDVDGNHIIDENDKQIIGNAQPDFTGGITNEFSYKNFSLRIFHQFSYGNDIYSYLNFQRHALVRYNNVSTDALRRWRQQGDVTDVPKPVRDDPMETDSRVQSRWVEDGSYIKLKSVTLAYQIPQSLLSRYRISSLRAYVTAQNLITWTHYTGYDPDVDSYSGVRIGIDEGAYPQSRTVAMGVNVGF